MRILGCLFICAAIILLGTACKSDTPTPVIPSPTAAPTQPTLTPAQLDCLGPDAFPTEEAELHWPELREVEPEQAAPGDKVKILGTGGNLYWDNECGQFWLESARDFQLFFDSEPAGFITCHASMCIANLTVPGDALPGPHTISVEGGSSLSIEVGDKSTSSPAPTQSPVAINTSTPHPTATEKADAGLTNLEAGPDATLHTPPPIGNGNCETYTAAMTLSATTTRLETGEVFTVTVALANQGCGSLGMPQYRLYVQSDEAQPVLNPGRPEPVVHYLGVAPGQSDAAEFVLRAVEPGRVTLSASASFEFHVGYPGPAYWGGSSAGPLVVTVKP